MNHKLPAKPGRVSIKTIDMHTGGEPLRVVIDGYPEIKGNSVLERRQYVREHLDHFRRALMWEPRGHRDMYGCLVVPPNDKGAAFGVIFMHNEGYSTMCGHATIALGRLATLLGWVSDKRFAMDAPCGRLEIEVSDHSVSFIGVPSFVLHTDQQVTLNTGQIIKFDIAYGGAFYAYVQMDESKLALVPNNYNQLKSLGGQIKQAIIQSKLPINHPYEADLSFLYGVILIGGPISPGVDSRNVCVFAEQEVDRCPTGSGVMGRLALHYQQQSLKLKESIRIESIVGSIFSGQIVETTHFGPHQAIIPKVSGNASITGEHIFHIDEDDLFKYGFIL